MPENEKVKIEIGENLGCFLIALVAAVVICYWLYSLSRMTEVGSLE